MIVSINPDYYSYTPDEWEVPRDKVLILEEIGQGSFGKVFRGSMKDADTATDILVAIKVRVLVTVHGTLFLGSIQFSFPTDPTTCPLELFILHALIRLVFLPCT